MLIYKEICRGSYRYLSSAICALNTGVWRTRDGDEIRRIPSVRHLRDQCIRAVLEKVVREVDELRRVFVTRFKEGEFKHCGCGRPDCPIYMLTHRVSEELDEARRKVLATFQSVCAFFCVKLR